MPTEQRGIGCFARRPVKGQDLNLVGFFLEKNAVQSDLRGGCSPTALPLSFWKALYLPVSVGELGVAEAPVSLPLAGQAGMQCGRTPPLLGGLVTLKSSAGWL